MLFKQNDSIECSYRYNYMKFILGRTQKELRNLILRLKLKYQVT